MKATGIVRRIDDLGRVVIPKEIRKTLRIREGDPLEIFTDRDGHILFKKYSPIGELSAFAKEYAESLHQTCKHIVLVIDKDQIIAVAGGSKKEFLDRKISATLESLLVTREPLVASNTDANFVSVLENDDTPSYAHQCIRPIIAAGDVIGAIALLSPTNKMTEVEIKLVENATLFLGKQMEG